ncbi:MAG TPA: hypothetical protein VNA11_20530, partial [Pseudonocardia sp.]|nr:hypothetical protein [Pseudonocardia sp.]
MALLARLPWFRHAYMPDWLRATLIGTMTHGQRVEARAALEQILRRVHRAARLAGVEGGAGSQRVGRRLPAGRRLRRVPGQRERAGGRGAARIGAVQVTVSNRRIDRTWLTEHSE